MNNVKASFQAFLEWPRELYSDPSDWTSAIALLSSLQKTVLPCPLAAPKLNDANDSAVVVEGQGLHYLHAPHSLQPGSLAPLYLSF